MIQHSPSVPRLLEIGTTTFVQGKYLKVVTYPYLSTVLKLNNFSDMHTAIDQGPDRSVEFYKEWVANVKRNVEEDRLLMFDVKEGWEPLCKFLNLPQPEVPFPHANDSETMKKTFANIKVMSRIVVWGLVAILVAIWGILMYYMY